MKQAYENQKQINDLLTENMKKSDVKFSKQNITLNI